MAEENKKFNLFYRQSLYPDAEGIFAFRPKSLVEIRDDCIVVLDTNSLLVPYTTGKDSLEQIRKIYKILVDAKRLVVPGQVAREFAEHRVTKLKELYQKIAQKKANISLGNYPLLDNLKEYQEALGLERDLNNSIAAYNAAIDKILNAISEWNWDDPVTKLYGELFAKDVILDPPFKEEDVKQRYEHNVVHKLPPGYKDSKVDKETGELIKGVGDLINWLTILEVSRANSKSVIFVSSDQKGDWWIRIEGRALYPRFELVDEFRRVSGGQSFHIIKFSDFLELYGASKEVVEQIQEEEKTISLSQEDSYLLDVDREVSFNDYFQNWYNSELGVQAAQSELDTLYKALRERIEQSNNVVNNIKIDLSREGNQIRLSCRDRCLLVEWKCKPDTLDDSVLLLEGYKCESGVDGILELNNRTSINEFDFDMGKSLKVGWRDRAFSNRLLTSEALAKELRDRVISAVRPR